MCQASERPQRRHRATYLAPSVGQWHQQQEQQQQFLHRNQIGVVVPGQSPQQQQSHQQLQQLLHQTPLPQREMESITAFEDSLSDLGIPLLLEVPYASAPLTVSPPSSGEASSYEFQQQMLSTPSVPPPKLTYREQIMDAFSGMYHGFVDFFLLVVVCFMGCFFYDVEVKVVQADRHRTRARGRSGRVIIRTQEQQRQQKLVRGTMTSLLRTPPRSANYSRGSRSPQPREDTMWEHVI